MYDFSEVEFALFLNNAVYLFNSTLRAVYSMPVFRFFMAAALFLIVVALLSRLVRQGKKGSL